MFIYWLPISATVFGQSSVDFEGLKVAIMLVGPSRYFKSDKTRRFICTLWMKGTGMMAFIALMGGLSHLFDVLNSIQG